MPCLFQYAFWLRAPEHISEAAEKVSIWLESQIGGNIVSEIRYWSSSAAGVTWSGWGFRISSQWKDSDFVSFSLSTFLSVSVSLPPSLQSSLFLPLCLSLTFSPSLCSLSLFQPLALLSLYLCLSLSLSSLSRSFSLSFSLSVFLPPPLSFSISLSFSLYLSPLCFSVSLPLSLNPSLLLSFSGIFFHFLSHSFWDERPTTKDKRRREKEGKWKKV